MSDRIRVAFVKYTGMTAGGTQRWLQAMASALPRDRFDVTYFWSDAAPAIGRPGLVGTPFDQTRVDHVEASGISTVRFQVGAVDLRQPHFPWRDTDFWDVFDPRAFDIVQTSKQGRAEYPYTEMSVPVFEQVAYTDAVDRSPAVVRSGHWSEWSRAWWWRRGGDAARSFVLPIPTEEPATDAHLRAELGIGPDDLVVGFHQRRDDRTMSEVQLAALARIDRPDVHLVVLGASTLYQQQAERLRLANTHFLDPSSDAVRISAFLNTLDVFIHGRRDGETFGLVLAEAMAHGVPCLSHRVVGMGNAQRETIGPGGAVVNDVDGYATELAELLGDENRRRLLASRGRRHAQDRYALGPAAQGLAEEYEAFLAGQPPRRRRSYGEVPGGALLTGVILDESEPAHGVLTGVAPCEAVSSAVVDAVASGRAARLVSVGEGLRPVALALLAQSRDAVALIAEADPAVTDWREQLELNGADGRGELAGIDSLSGAELGEDVVLVARGPVVARAGIPIARLRQAYLLVVADCPDDLRAALPDPLDVVVDGGRWTVAGPGAVQAASAMRGADHEVRHRRLRTAAGRRWHPVRQAGAGRAHALGQAVHAWRCEVVPRTADGGGLVVHYGEHPGATGQHLAEAAGRMGVGTGLPRPHRTHVPLSTLDASTYLWVEAGKTSLPVDAHAAPFTTAGYLIDAHLHPGLSRLQAQLFDVVFVAQSDLLAEVAGDHPQAQWLPLAAPASFLELPRTDRFEAGFVGNVAPGSARERVLLAVEATVEMNDWRQPHLPSEMAEVYAGSRVVVNPPANGDLNMRFFEALACGAAVVTAPIGNGQADLAVEGRDFVLADFGQPAAVVAAVREAVARGASAPHEDAERRRLVAHGHTYDHRVRTIVRTLADAGREAPVRSMGEVERARLLADLAAAYEDAGLLVQSARTARGRGIPTTVPLVVGRIARREVVEAVDRRAPAVSAALRRRRRPRASAFRALRRGRRFAAPPRR